MRKIYKIDRSVYGKIEPVYYENKTKPVYYENIVDLVEELALSYYNVYVAGSEDLLNAIKATALLYYPLFHKDMSYTIWNPETVIPHSLASTCVVSEVGVDQNGHLLSTPC